MVKVVVLAGLKKAFDYISYYYSHIVVWKQYSIFFIIIIIMARSNPCTTEFPNNLFEIEPQYV